MSRKVVYIAHPLGAGPDREQNRANASRWCAWALLVGDVVPVADWIVLSGVLSEDHRTLGLEADLALIERVDEVWLVGGRISPGMAIEAGHAQKLGKKIVDLTHMGYPAPLPSWGTMVGERLAGGTISAPEHDEVAP